METGRNSAVQVLASFSALNKQLAVTVKLQAGTSKYNFSLAQNSQTLQGTKLQNLIYQFDGNVTKDQNGNTICSEAVSDSARIFLKDTSGNVLIVDGTPLVMFKRENVNFPVQAFDDSKIDWQNSYVQLQAAYAGTTGDVLEFFVNYKPCN
jgi:hypothetical protein